METVDIRRICDLLETAVNCPHCRKLANAAIAEYNQLPHIVAKAARALVDVQKPADNNRYVATLRVLTEWREEVGLDGPGNDYFATWVKSCLNSAKEKEPNCT